MGVASYKKLKGSNAMQVWFIAFIHLNYFCLLFMMGDN
jgi:hypothetical protein